MTKQGWTHKGVTKSNKDPNLICWMARAKLWGDVNSQFPWFLIRTAVCAVIKWDRNREKRQKEREKSSLYMRYNKKGSSNWGLKPPVVRSVHFSNRGGTHCLLCAQRMAHTKNTHQCGDKPKRTHFNTEMQHSNHGLHSSSSDSRKDLQLSHIYKTIEENLPPIQNECCWGHFCKCKAGLWYKATAVSFQLLNHSLTNCECCWKTRTQKRKAAQCIYSLTTGETRPIQQWGWGQNLWYSIAHVRVNLQIRHFWWLWTLKVAQDGK